MLLKWSMKSDGDLMGLDWEQGSDWLWRSGCLLALLGPTAEKRKKGTPEGIRL